MTTTNGVNYSNIKQITPGTEKDIWGPIYNTSQVEIDAQIKLRQNEAAAAVLKAGDTMTGRLNHPASAATGIAAGSMRIPAGVAPSSPTAGDIWATSTNLLMRFSSTSHTFITDNYATFAVKVTTPASVAGFAGLILPHGTAPSAPVNGDIWTTTAGLLARINGTSVTFSIVGHAHAIADTTGLQTALDAKAPLASPALTGTPTAPTAATTTDTTQVATTAFVQQEARTVVPNTQSGAGTYTLVLADAGKIILRTSASAQNITIPSGVFPNNTWIEWVRGGAGALTFVASGVTINCAVAAPYTAGDQYSGGSLWHAGSNVWYLFGTFA